MRATLDGMNLTCLVVLASSSCKSEHFLHDESINRLLEGMTAVEVGRKSVLLKVMLEDQLAEDHREEPDSLINVEILRIFDIFDYVTHGFRLPEEKSPLDEYHDRASDKEGPEGSQTSYEDVFTVSWLSIVNIFENLCTVFQCLILGHASKVINGDLLTFVSFRNNIVDPGEMKVLPATSLIDTNFFVGKLNFAKIFD
jgi:hypothetical protein